MMVKPGPNDRIYSAAKLAKVTESLASEGVAAADVLRGLHVSASALYASGTRVSANQMIDACRNAAELSHDPQFACHTGSQFHVTTFGMFGYAMLSSGTFREAISFALRYYQLGAPLCESLFREEHGRAKWMLIPIAHPRVDAGLYKFVVELEMSGSMTVARDVMGSSFVAREVRFSFGPPADAALYEQMFGCAVLFRQRQNQLIFDAAWLDRAPRLGNAITYAEVVKVCELLMDQMRLRIGLSGKVREVLLLNVMKQISLEEVAQRLHVTARTLRRKLREEHTSFRQLVDDLKMRVAFRYLSETDLSIEELAHALGFSEDASFRHAFRRWTNIAPTEYRARLKGPDAGGVPTALVPLSSLAGQRLSKTA